MPGEGGGGSVYFNRLEPEQTQAMVIEIEPGQNFFDVGANVGYYSILASALVGTRGTVTAFEPVVENIVFLRQHVVLNRTDNVRILPLAVSDEEGISKFSSGPVTSMGALVRDDGAGDMLVATTTLDSIVQYLKIVPDVIKVDVEGAEMRVLGGATSLLKERRPKIFLSTHSKELREECLRFLKGFGYFSEALVKTDNPHEFLLKV
jgi:FkbM family methyltransferase